MMDVITDPLIDEVTVMKSVRTGGTQAVIDNAVGYFMDQDPGPMLVVHPGKNEARDWSKDHFDNMVRDTPVLHGRVFSDKIKDRKNEILHKQFPGGIIFIIGSNSAAGFRQKTIQRVFLDDVDGYEPSAGSEGDQIELARNRTITYLYHSRKIIKVSNPTTRGLSRIEQEYFASDQRHYYVPCPLCGYGQILVFSPESQFSSLTQGYLKFDKENLSWVAYQCSNCQQPIDEKQKLQMIRSGKWMKLQPAVIGHAGFHLNELTSTFSSWHEVAKGFLNTKKMKERLRVFINQRLGETFVEDKSYEIDESSLIARVEDYLSDEKPWVPKGVLCMTAAVDVQEDRLEPMVVGWGVDEECWIIDHRVIFGSPELEKTWRELDTYLETGWKHETGIDLSPWSTHGVCIIGIDSGYQADKVYRYVRDRQAKRRFFALKGYDERGRKKSGEEKEFILDIHYKNRTHARLAIVNDAAIKSRIYERLGYKEPGPGFIHFPKSRCNAKFFEQLTAEERVTVRNENGYYERIWRMKKDRSNNEVLDCLKYNFAMHKILRPNYEALKERLDEKVKELGMQTVSVDEPGDKSGPEGEGRSESFRRVQPPRRPGGGFLNRWKL